jgi:transposase
MGESRLVERDGTWYLHVTATRDVKNCSGASTDERTPIGVDIGEASLVTVCHRDDQGVPTHPELWAEEGKTVRRLRKTYFIAMGRLQARGSDRIAESYGDDLWTQIDDVFHRVTRQVVEHAESVENPAGPRRTDVHSGVDGLW